MTTDQQANDALRALAREPIELSEESLRTVLAAIPSTPQQRPWLPPFPGWAYRSVVSATKFVVAGVIVALVGGFLLLAQPFDQQRGVPGTTTSAGPGTFSPTGSLTQPRQGHSATLLPDGRVLIVGGADDGYDIGIDLAEIWDPGTGTFGPAGSHAEAPWGHTATLLPDGRVLVVGFGAASAEVWDPDTSTFGPAGSHAERRDEHIATLLPDGRVLIVGGGNGGVRALDRGRMDDKGYRRELYEENIGGVLDLAEVWDPATNTFSSAGSHTWSQWHAVTALRDGRILVVGGSGAGGVAEVWDPATGTFSPAGSHGMEWVWPSATLLPDGRVLVIGGSGAGDSAEVWDPATSTFSPTGSPAMDGISNATLLSDGRVLVLAGSADPESAKVWDPGTGTFSPAGSLLAVGSYYEPTALPDGRVLIVGGCVGECYGGYGATEDNNWVLASVELWDPVANTFTAAGPLSVARTGHSTTVLRDGRVLVVGGWGGLGVGVHASAEIWTPSDR